MLASWKKGYKKPRQHIKGRDITLPTKVYTVKAMVFPVVIYGCKSWAINKAECPRINAFNYEAGKDSWESLKNKEFKPFNSKGNEPSVFIEWTDSEAKAEAPILWPPDVKGQLIEKDPDAGKDWGQEEKRATEDEMVGCLHWLSGHEFKQTLGDSEGQRRLSAFHGLAKDIHDLAIEQWIKIIPLSFLRQNCANNPSFPLSLSNSLQWLHIISIAHE